MHKTAGATRFDTDLMRADMTARGWLVIDLARAAHVSHMTVGRFFSGERQTARTAMKIAVALEQPLARYLIAAAAVVDALDEAARQLPLALPDEARVR